MERQGAVLSRVGGRYRVFSDGAVIDATLRGRLKHGARDRVLVGDRVELAVHLDGSATIERVLPRRTLLKRRSPGRATGERAVAANVDQLVVVGAAAQPRWDPGLIDRFTAVAAANDIPAFVVVNKCDLVDDCEGVVVPYRDAGYEPLATSVPRGQGLDELRDRLLGHTSLFTGPTGVGKSSLLNALQPGLQLKTGAVSRKSQAGRHTTVSAEMHPFGDRGFVVDTPGLRDVGLWGLSPAEVGRAFPEFGDHAPHCRFDNCRHVQEPGCAVVAAVGEGAVAESRLRSYRRLLEEAERAARPWA